MVSEQGCGKDCTVPKSGATGVTYIQIARLLLVLSFLFVVVDVIRRGNGFVYYYASFGKFIPTLSLVMVFWSSAALVASVVLWSFCWVFVWFFRRVGWNFREEHFLLFMGLFAFWGAAVWMVKLYTVSYGTTFTTKAIALFSVCAVSVFLTWLCRNKIERWFETLQKLFAPFVRFLGVLILVSLAIVGYSYLKR